MIPRRYPVESVEVERVDTDNFQRGHLGDLEQRDTRQRQRLRVGEVQGHMHLEDFGRMLRLWDLLTRSERTDTFWSSPWWSGRRVFGAGNARYPFYDPHAVDCVVPPAENGLHLRLTLHKSTHNHVRNKTFV